MDDATTAETLFGTQTTPEAPAQPSADDVMAARLFGPPPTPAPARTAPVSDPAARLFGGPDAKQVPEEARQPRTDDEMQETLYGKSEAPEVEIDIPADILSERNADKERVMFSPQVTFRETLPDTMWDGDPAAESLPEHVRGAMIGEMREMAADVGMSVDDVKTLRDLGATFKAEPNEEQIITWREQSVELLNRTYGKHATQALRDAQALIALDPRRAKWLELNNRGDHPKVIEVFARLGRKARLAGKLKAKNGHGKR